MSDINKKKSSSQVLYLNIGPHLNDNFDWNNVRILDSEPSYNKILTSEMIFMRQKNGLNLQSDTESLPEIYSPIIQTFSPS